MNVAYTPADLTKVEADLRQKSYSQVKNEIQQRSIRSQRNCTHKNRVRLDFGSRGKATFCVDCGFEFAGTESF